MEVLQRNLQSIGVEKPMASNREEIEKLLADKETKQVVQWARSLKEGKISKLLVRLYDLVYREYMSGDSRGH